MPPPWHSSRLPVWISRAISLMDAINIAFSDIVLLSSRVCHCFMSSSLFRHLRFVRVTFDQFQQNILGNFIVIGITSDTINRRWRILMDVFLVYKVRMGEMRKYTKIRRNIYPFLSFRQIFRDVLLTVKQVHIRSVINWRADGKKQSVKHLWIVQKFSETFNHSLLNY